VLHNTNYKLVKNYYTSEYQEQTRQQTPQSLVAKLATAVYEDCQQSVDHNNWRQLSVADKVDTGVSGSQLSADDHEILLRSGKTQSHSKMAVFLEFCEADHYKAEVMLCHLIAGGTQHLITNMPVYWCHTLGVVEPASL